jgi:endonuclease/exonuclease/phosphatase family metal-dependent hydrolase
VRSHQPPPADHTPTPATIDLRVMTFNIRYGTADDGDNRWSNRRELVPAVIEAHEPDVVGLQEALHFQLQELLAALPQFGSVGVGRTDGATKGEYAAILYRTDRFDLDRDERGTFWFSDTPEVPGSRSFGNQIERICTWVRLIDRQSQAAFYVFNVHLDHRSQPSRERSTQMLVERIRARTHNDDPFVITGDFNAAPDNPAILTLLTETTAASLGIADCYRLRNEPSANEGTFGAFNGTTDGHRIDYVFAGKGASTRASYIVHDHDEGRYPSDHFPVVADLSLPVTSPADRSSPRP